MPISNLPARVLWALALFSTSLLLGFSGCAEDKPAPKAHGPVAVETAEVTLAPWPETVEALATVQASQGARVKAQAEGRVTVIQAKSGQDVQAGDLLLMIDPQDLSARLAVAQSNLALAKKDYDRAAVLNKKGDIAKQQYDHAGSALHTSRAEVKRIQALMDLTRVEAPVDGRLGLFAVNPGDWVHPGQDLVNLQDTGKLRVEFSVPERFGSRLAVGQTVELAADALPGEIISAKVYAFEPAVDESDRGIRVRAGFDQPPAGLLPGGFCRATLVLDNQQKALAVPQTAVAHTPTQTYVFKVVEGKAVKTTVNMGQRKKGLVRIKSGLAQGDTVVSAGLLKLRDGAKVNQVK